MCFEVSPLFVIIYRAILDADVTDETFISQLLVLSQKINFVQEQNSKGKKNYFQYSIESSFKNKF